MKLYIFADKEIFEVKTLNGSDVRCYDSTGWAVTVPLSRVERFCNKEGFHIDFEIGICNIQQSIDVDSGVCKEVTFN